MATQGTPKRRKLGTEETKGESTDQVSELANWMFTDRPVFEPTQTECEGTSMFRFKALVEKKFGVALASYNELWQWSVDNTSEFWGLMWEYFDVRSSKPYSTVVDDLGQFPGAKWFPGAQLNFAENIMRFNDDRVAYIYQSDCSRQPQQITYRELHDRVARLAAALRKLGLSRGDRVGAFLPNLPSTAVAMLAVTSIGAIWSSCSPDFGEQGVIDRFGQIEPKMVLATEAYYYKGKFISVLGRVKSLVARLPSAKSTVILPYALNGAFSTDLSSIPGAVHFNDIVVSEGKAPELEFEQVPFEHPVYIMYSSGTTGKPKCIVQGTGVLLNHLKELVLHCNITRDDRLFYYTTTGWMMWNWLTSGLATGCTVVLWEGNPCYPRMDSLFQMAQDLRVTIFGTSARYLQAIMDAGCVPARDYDLTALRTILSTGSPATQNTFAFVHAKIKPTVQFASISGGTDLNGCFALGNPMLPVYSAELQCRALGLDVTVWNSDGKEVLDTEGELVCLKPFPSMPLFFWNDDGGEKFNAAYFDTYPGVWRHGDFATLTSRATPGMIVHGRSDATLNPGGVRMGTADIYSAVDETISDVSDSVVIGQSVAGDVRVVLFVKMKGDAPLTPELVKAIKQRIRTQVSPKHVPAIVLACPDIPYTVSGKKVELAVRNMVEGRPVRNRSALSNPDSLDFFANIPALAPPATADAISN